MSDFHVQYHLVELHVLNSNSTATYLHCHLIIPKLQVKSSDSLGSLRTRIAKLAKTSPGKLELRKRKLTGLLLKSDSQTIGQARFNDGERVVGVAVLALTIAMPRGIKGTLKARSSDTVRKTKRRARKVAKITGSKESYSVKELHKELRHSRDSKTLGAIGVKDRQTVLIVPAIVLTLKRDSLRGRTRRVVVPNTISLGKLKARIAGKLGEQIDSSCCYTCLCACLYACLYTRCADRRADRLVEGQAAAEQRCKALSARHQRW